MKCSAGWLMCCCVCIMCVASCANCCEFVDCGSSMMAVRYRWCGRVDYVQRTKSPCFTHVHRPEPSCRVFLLYVLCYVCVYRVHSKRVNYSNRFVHDEEKEMDIVVAYGGYLMYSVE